MPIITSTGDIKENYKIIDTIFAIDSHKEGFFSGPKPSEAFEKVKQQLMARCEQMGGDAVIHCQFEYRVALAGGKKQVLEIFAYGTVVKLV